MEIAFLEALASDVAVDLNVLGVFMEDIVMSNVDSTMIITIKEEWQWAVEHPCRLRDIETKQACRWC